MFAGSGSSNRASLSSVLVRLKINPSCAPVTLIPVGTASVNSKILASAVTLPASAKINILSLPKPFASTPAPNTTPLLESETFPLPANVISLYLTTSSLVTNVM